MSNATENLKLLISSLLNVQPNLHFPLSLTLHLYTPFYFIPLLNPFPLHLNTPFYFSPVLNPYPLHLYTPFYFIPVLNPYPLHLYTPFYFSPVHNPYPLHLYTPFYFSPVLNPYPLQKNFGFRKVLKIHEKNYKFAKKILFFFEDKILKG